MSTKKYIAKSHVSLMVAMSETKNAHISFTPLTGGGSVFYTSDERVQSALEKHHKFGKLFNIDPTYKEVKKVADAPMPKKASIITEVHVTCLDDAKDYLSDKFGISRTKLRSEESIMANAAAHNVKFIGIE